MSHFIEIAQTSLWMDYMQWPSNFKVTWHKN